MIPSPPLDELRRSLRERRLALDPEARAASAVALSRQIAALPWFLHSWRIAFHLPVKGEIDLGPLMRRASDAGKELYLPVLAPESRLWFVHYRPGDALVPNRYGIDEPRVPPGEPVDPATLDLILVPLVAFDAQGNRLGMGGGYYDRSFAFLLHRGHSHKPRLLGVAYELQRVERLEPAPWDVRLDAVATEQGVYLSDERDGPRET
jgi:5-formyltetrahydrofolate cyclo-ligase